MALVSPAPGLFSAKPGSKRCRALLPSVFLAICVHDMPNAILQIYDGFVEVQEKAFPSYMEELRGIADGSGQPLLHILLINLDEELTYFLPNITRRVCVCTRVHAPRHRYSLWASPISPNLTFPCCYRSQSLLLFLYIAFKSRVQRSKQVCMCCL